MLAPPLRRQVDLGPGGTVKFDNLTSPTVNINLTNNIPVATPRENASSSPNTGSSLATPRAETANRDYPLARTISPPRTNRAAALTLGEYRVLRQYGLDDDSLELALDLDEVLAVREERGKRRIMTQTTEGSKAERPVQRLPLNVVQQLKRDPAAGRYGRSELMDAKEKQELLYTVQDENLALKKTNQKLAEQVKQLGVRFGQIQKEMHKEGLQLDKPATQKEVERLHKSLQEGFGGSSSSTAMPWVPAAANRSKSPGPAVTAGSKSPGGAGGNSGGGISRQTKRALSGGGTGMLRNRSAMSPNRNNFSPERSGVAKMLVEETENLRKTIAELKDKNERLTNQMEGVMSARGGKGVSAVEVAFYREQLDDKEQRIKQLQKQLDDDRDVFHKERKENTATVNRLEKEKLAVESDLRHALALGDETENASLHRKLKESDEMNKKLMEKINALTANAFISTADTRVASAKRLERLEEELVEKQKALEEALSQKETLKKSVDEMGAKMKSADDKFKTTWEENERFRIRLEEREKQAKAVEDQLRVLRDSLPAEERAAVEKSLSIALTSTPLFGVGAAAASSGGELAKEDLTSVEGMTKTISQLRREKADLAQEMGALQNILRRESEINAELKTLHQYDLADLQTKSESMLGDREKWERLAKSREAKVKELQKQIRKLEQVQEEKEEDIVSEAGFSDISETAQTSTENALDLVVNSAKMEFKVLSQHFFPNLPIFMAENALMSNVLIDFYEFDSVSSRTASGLEPRYDSIITCSPFAMNEAAIKHFNQGVIKFSLQAFVIQQGQQQQPAVPGQPVPGQPVVVGEATLPLVHLLNCTPLDPNPMVSGTLKFVSKRDPNTTIATLAYKMKLRYSVLDLLHNFQHQRNRDELSLQMAKPEFDPALVGQVVDFDFARVDAVLDELTKAQWAAGSDMKPLSKSLRFPYVSKDGSTRVRTVGGRTGKGSRGGRSRIKSPAGRGSGSSLSGVTESGESSAYEQDGSFGLGRVSQGTFGKSELAQEYLERISATPASGEVAAAFPSRGSGAAAQPIPGVAPPAMGGPVPPVVGVPVPVQNVNITVTTNPLAYPVAAAAQPPSVPGLDLKSKDDGAAPGARLNQFQGDATSGQPLPPQTPRGVGRKTELADIGAVSPPSAAVRKIPAHKAAEGEQSGQQHPIMMIRESGSGYYEEAIGTPRYEQENPIAKPLTPQGELEKHPPWLGARAEEDGSVLLTPRRRTSMLSPRSAATQWSIIEESQRKKKEAPAEAQLSPRSPRANQSASERWSETQKYIDNPGFARRYFQQRESENWAAEGEKPPSGEHFEYAKNGDWKNATKSVEAVIANREEEVKRAEAKEEAVVGQAKENSVSKQVEKLLDEGGT